MDIANALLLDLRYRLPDSDRALDLRVARDVMGLTPEQVQKDNTEWVFTIDRTFLQPGDWYVQVPDCGMVEIPRYSGDPQAARRVEELLAERGPAVRDRYARALAERVGGEPFAVLHAAPRDRMRAAIDAVSQPTAVSQQKGEAP